jgi:hypothetical protein
MGEWFKAKPASQKTSANTKQPAEAIENKKSGVAGWSEDAEDAPDPEYDYSKMTTDELRKVVAEQGGDSMTMQHKQILLSQIEKMADGEARQDIVNQIMGYQSVSTHEGGSMANGVSLTNIFNTMQNVTNHALNYIGDNRYSRDITNSMDSALQSGYQTGNWYNAMNQGMNSYDATIKQATNTAMERWVQYGTNGQLQKEGILGKIANNFDILNNPELKQQFIKDNNLTQAQQNALNSIVFDPSKFDKNMFEKDLQHGAMFTGEVNKEFIDPRDKGNNFTYQTQKMYLNAVGVNLDELIGQSYNQNNHEIGYTFITNEGMGHGHQTADGVYNDKTVGFVLKDGQLSIYEYFETNADVRPGKANSTPPVTTSVASGMYDALTAYLDGGKEHPSFQFYKSGSGYKEEGRTLSTTDGDTCNKIAAHSGDGVRGTYSARCVTFFNPTDGKMNTPNEYKKPAYASPNTQGYNYMDLLEQMGATYNPNKKNATEYQKWNYDNWKSKKGTWIIIN